MTIWPPEAGALKRPVYRSLAQSLIDAVEAGQVQPGERLPTHRSLAYRLGISVQTVSRAYEELIRLGVIAGHVGRGTFVRAGPSDTRTPWHRIGRSEEVIDCSMLMPVRGEIHMERMRAALARLAKDVPKELFFSFRPRATLEPHCERAVGWLARCGVETQPERIIPTNGNTSAMTVALMTAAKPGDLVVTEELGHHTLKPLCRYLGLRVSGLRVDAEGIVPAAFERACAVEGTRILFTLPSGLSPMASMMGAARRTEICEIARKYEVTIVENDAWGPLEPHRPVPLAALAPERVLYFTGLSKCILPGLRLGWLVVPETLTSAALNRHLVTNWMATPMMAEIGSRWLEDGTALELLEWQQRAIARRNRIAAEILGELSPRSTPRGLHVWLPLPSQWNETAFVSHARLNGVAVAAGSAFAVADEVHHSGVRICLGAASESALTRGLGVLARLARNEPEPALLAI